MTAHIAPGRMKLLGSGSSLPGLPVSNHRLLDHLASACGERLGTRAGSIVKKLGIEQRHLTRRLDQPLSKPQISAPVLSAQAIRSAMDEAKNPEPGFMISHTASPHTLLPSSAAWIADELNFAPPYMELRQACTGFANAVQIAQAMLHGTPGTKPIVLVGTETGSVFFEISKEFIDINQLVNYVQMGDGAGAVILGADDNSERAIISDCYVGHIGIDQEPGFKLVGGSSDSPVCDSGFPRFEHNPRAVRDNGPKLILKGLETVLEMGYQLKDFAYIIPHQANGHIDTMLAEHLDISPDRVVNDARQLGNLGSAAIWVSFDRLRKSGQLQQGDKVLILGAEATKYMYGGFVYTH